MDVGYIRVSSVDQNTDRQLDGVLVQKTFEEKVSGATMDRPQLQAAVVSAVRVTLCTCTASTALHDQWPTL